MGRIVTSLSIFSNASWPFLTIPHFEARASDYLTMSKAESITLAPVVPDNQREAYENYTVNNQQWIQEGIDYMFQVQQQLEEAEGTSLFNDDDFYSTTDDSPNNDLFEHVVNSEGFSRLHKAKPIQPFLWTHAPQTHRAIPENANASYYVPIWQTYPAPRNSYVVGNNLLGAPEFQSLILSTQQEPHLAVLSDVFDDNFRLFGSAQTIDEDPKSVLLQPIFRDMKGARSNQLKDEDNNNIQESAERSNLIVGYMIVIKKWHQIFQNVLYEGATPLVVVLKNTCGKAFSYKVIGSKAKFMGRGDLHDSRYDEMEAISPLFGYVHGLSSECNYTLHIYPTREMEDAYMTSLPLYVLLTVLAFCTILAFGLYVYNRMTRTHQANQLKGLARAERAFLKIEHAQQAAASERQLNEFIAHEVRNPLSAAMSACSFVSSAVQDLPVLLEPSPIPVAPRQLPTAATNPRSEEPPKPLFAIPPKATAPPLFSLQVPATTSATIPTATITATGASVTQQQPPPAPLFALPKASPTAATPTKQSQQQQEVEAQKESIMEDLHIIESSLQFINDLLRNMLDVQRAAHHQLKIEIAPTDVVRDILEHVDAMLYRRGQPDVEVIVENCCGGEDIMVMTDRLRLKQVVLNLSRNSAKFVEKGFIRFKVVMSPRGHVQIWIEDSGPGIPEEKKGKLFAKFQESLDSLSQGTGLGLSLCQILIGLMGGAVWLDETYNSGLEGRPGARFIIDLQKAPLLDDLSVAMKGDKSSKATSFDGGTEALGLGDGKDTNSSEKLSKPSQVLPEVLDLPKYLRILVVDDDTTLRKLLVRAVHRIAPEWKIQQAASGEAAIRLIEEVDGNDDGNDSISRFALIFMDQYMASTEKQLLGTETTKALRSKGVTSRICGLSANGKSCAPISRSSIDHTPKPNRAFSCKFRHGN